MDVPDLLRAALSGRYEIEREIGAGGMATVSLARDLRRSAASCQIWQEHPVHNHHTIRWANKPEFLGDVDKAWRANLGYSYKISDNGK
jgi:hypothetical protein